MKRQTLWIMLSLGTLVVVGCAGAPGVGQLDELAQKIANTSFRDEGNIKVAKVFDTDEANWLCSQADVAGVPLDEKASARIEEANLKAIEWPQDGKFLGDWKQGEEIAQSGRGLTYGDDPSMPNGGNCYNCHQITKEEISFGTIGPSLYHYAKLRGVSDPASEDAKPIVTYTWGKIWNSRAYNACSKMPRSGHMGILTAQQISHVMALLLDPQSPVNR
jgi:sulfur-oxidizing protein SoxX